MSALFKLWRKCLRLLIGILAFLLGLAILAVTIDETCSRHETEWARGRTGFVQKIASTK